MSRQWKKPNHALPGWGGYESSFVSQVSNGAYPKNKRGSGFRKWLRKKKKAKWLAKQRCPDHQPEPVKHRYLELENPYHISVWRGRYGKWHCVSSPAPYEWFLRAAHPDTVRQFLDRNHMNFQWHKEPPVPKCLPDSPSKPVVESESVPALGVPPHEGKPIGQPLAGS